jgi:dipeptidase E
MESSKRNLLLLSGSKAAGNLPDGVEPGYLDFAEPWIQKFFSKAVADHKPILFVPYADAEISEQKYFEKTRDRLAKMGIDTVCASAKGLTEKDFENVGGMFIGGGHTYTLLHKLQQNGAVDLIRQKVAEGLPYMGSSAGTIITCPTIKTTNDMPCPAHDVIYLKSLGLIGMQLSCHYIDDTMQDKKHQGETRDIRLKEFCVLNPDKAVLGLYEGQVLRVEGDRMQIFSSERCRKTNSPVFINDKREEIECKIGVPKDVSDIFRVQKPAVQPRRQPSGPRR